MLFGAGVWQLQERGESYVWLESRGSGKAGGRRNGRLGGSGQGQTDREEKAASLFRSAGHSHLDMHEMRQGEWRAGQVPRGHRGVTRGGPCTEGWEGEEGEQGCRVARRKKEVCGLHGQLHHTFLRRWVKTPHQTLWNQPGDVALTRCRLCRIHLSGLLSRLNNKQLPPVWTGFRLCPGLTSLSAWQPDSSVVMSAEPLGTQHREAPQPPGSPSPL